MLTVDMPLPTQTALLDSPEMNSRNSDLILNFVLWNGSNEGELLLISLRPKEAILSEGGYGERCSFGDGSYGDGRIEDDLMMLLINAI